MNKLEFENLCAVNHIKCSFLHRLTGGDLTNYVRLDWGRFAVSRDYSLAVVGDINRASEVALTAMLKHIES